MKGSTFAKEVRGNTYTDSTTLPDTDLAHHANVVKDELVEYINKEVGEDYFQMTLKRTLKAGQREYSFPNDIIRNLKRVSAKLDGENWVVLWETDVTQFSDPLVTDSNVQDAMVSKEPAIDIQGRGFRILSQDEMPESDVSEGLQIEAMIYPSNISETELSGSRSDIDLSVPASNIEHAVPRAAHRVWSLMTSIAYKQSRPRPIVLNAEERQIEVKKQQMRNNLRIRNLDRSLEPNSPEDNGLDY